MVEFDCVRAEKKWGSVLVCGGCGCGLWWFIRKIRPTQLWVELSWVVAIKMFTFKIDPAIHIANGTRKRRANFETSDTFDKMLMLFIYLGVSRTS